MNIPCSGLWWMNHQKMTTPIKQDKMMVVNLWRRWRYWWWWTTMKLVHILTQRLFSIKHNNHNASMIHTKQTITKDILLSIPMKTSLHNRKGMTSICVNNKRTGVFISRSLMQYGDLCYLHLWSTSSMIMMIVPCSTWTMMNCGYCACNRRDPRLYISEEGPIPRV